MGKQPAVMVVVQDEATRSQLSQMNAAILGSWALTLLRRPHCGGSPFKAAWCRGGRQPAMGNLDERRCCNRVASC